MERCGVHCTGSSASGGGGGGGRGCCLSQDIFEVRGSNGKRRTLFIAAPISDGQFPRVSRCDSHLSKHVAVRRRDNDDKTARVGVILGKMLNRGARAENSLFH